MEPPTDRQLIQEAARVIGGAVDDLQGSGYPVDDLTRVLASLEDDDAVGAAESCVPYFIPNDLSLCTERSVLTPSWPPRSTR